METDGKTIQGLDYMGKLERKHIIIGFLIIFIIILSSCSNKKEYEEEIKVAISRTQESFKALQSGDNTALLNFMYDNLDEKYQQFIESEIGRNLMKQMTFSVNGIEKTIKNEELNTICKVSIKIKSIDMSKIKEVYQEITKTEGYSKEGIITKYLNKAIEKCSKDKVKTSLTINVYYYPDMGGWKVGINNDLFNALFPNFDQYYQWRYGN